MMTLTAKRAATNVVAKLIQYAPVASVTTRVAVGGTSVCSKRRCKVTTPSGVWSMANGRFGATAKAASRATGAVMAAISIPTNC